MKIKTALLCSVLLAGMTGCASTEQVTLGKQSIPTHLTSVAQVTQDNDSADMDKNLHSAISAAGLEQKASLPAGTMKAANVDGLISYSDKWRWDLVMYLNSVTINLFDAKTGDLLVTGAWNNSVLHSFPDSKKVVDNLLQEMMAKVRAAEQINSASK